MEQLVAVVLVAARSMRGGIPKKVVLCVLTCRARLRRSYPAMSTRTIAALVSDRQRLCLTVPLSAPWLFIISYSLAWGFVIVCSPKFSAPHSACASARRV